MFRLLTRQQKIHKSFVLKRNLCDCETKCELSKKVDDDNGFVQQMGIGAFCVAGGGFIGLHSGVKGLFAGMMVGCLVAIPVMGLNGIFHLMPRGLIIIMNCRQRHEDIKK